MFFKMSILKKMIKEAYKSKCLIIGHEEVINKEDGTIDREGYIIVGGWWSIYIEHDFAPKELKAALMEIAGEIPCGNRYFRVLDEGNQEHLGIGDSGHPMKLFARCKYDVNITKMAAVFLDYPVRLLQNSCTQEVTGIKELACELIDKKSIDYDNGEYEPIGPRTDDTNIMCWGNNICYFAVWPYKLLDEEKEQEKILFWKELSELNLPI